MPHSGPRRPTIVDVAAEAKVALSTASKALNGQSRVDPRTRTRVQEAAERLGYRPNVRAQRLRTGRSNSIALVTGLPASVVSADAEMGFLLALALPIARRCLEHDYSLLLVPPLTDLAELDRLDIDGAIIVDPDADAGAIERLQDRKIRVVTIGRSARAVEDGCLDRGDVAADIMLQHLREQGATHIAVLLTKERYPLTESFLARLPERGDDGTRLTVVRASVTDGISAREDAIAEALRADPTIDAVYAPLDIFAVAALRAAEALGLHVPGDLLLATNYDGRRATESRPQLTALDLNLPQMGVAAAELLLRLLEGGSATVAASPSPTVIPRESTLRTN